MKCMQIIFQYLNVSIFYLFLFVYLQPILYCSLEIVFVYRISSPSGYNRQECIFSSFDKFLLD